MLVKLSECIFQKKGEAGLQSSALTYNLGKCLMIEIPPADITDTCKEKDICLIMPTLYRRCGPPRRPAPADSAPVLR